MPNHPIAYKGSEPYIFVSYAHKDSEIILPLIQGLQDRGFRVWYDAGIEVGTEWPDYIAEHLNGSACVIAFISRNSVASHNCRREINFAIELRKDPLVIYMEELELPLGMRMQLGTLHAVYYERYANSEEFLDEVCAAEVLRPCGSGSDAQPVAPKPKIDPVERMYQKGKTAFDKGDYEGGLVSLQMAAAKGHIEAMLRLGYFYMDIRQNIFSALAYFEKAEQKGSDTGAWLAKTCRERLDVPPEEAYQNGLQAWSEQDHAVAGGWFYRAAIKGHAAAQQRTADCYYYGHGTSINYAEAAQWAAKSAQQGYPVAQYDLGYYYHYGRGVKQDRSLSVKWFRAAAEQGHVKAQVALGTCYSAAEGVPRDLKEAERWFREAAEQGCMEAKHLLGVCLERQGETAAAMDCYIAAAEGGWAQAQAHLARLYHKQQDSREEAVKWCREAEKSGDRYILGTCVQVYRALQMHSDTVRVCKYLAEKYKDADAMKTLALCYGQGLGVKLSYELSNLWRSRAKQAPPPPLRNRIPEK